MFSALREWPRRRSIALALAFCAFTGCTTDQPSGGAKGEASQNSERGTGAAATAADRQLLQFGAQNPECPLWTNWQKLCSRTGPDGAPRCSTDQGMKVEPSAPFCAGGFLGNPENQKGEQLVSDERFCTKHETYTALSARGERHYQVCTRHARERPFNGRRIAALVHPWCETWSEMETNKPVCSAKADPKNGIASCAALAAATMNIHVL
jgi:hypothetical protein